MYAYAGFVSNEANVVSWAESHAKMTRSTSHAYRIQQNRMEASIQTPRPALGAEADRPENTGRIHAVFLVVS